MLLQHVKEHTHRRTGGHSETIHEAQRFGHCMCIHSPFFSLLSHCWRAKWAARMVCTSSTLFWGTSDSYTCTRTYIRTPVLRQNACTNLTTHTIHHTHITYVHTPYHTKPYHTTPHTHHTTPHTHHTHTHHTHTHTTHTPHHTHTTYHTSWWKKHIQEITLGMW